MIRDSIEDDCPSNDYTPGDASGTCWGDGHYLCRACKHYRKDFKEHGQDFIDFAHAIQGGMIIRILKEAI